MLLSLNNVVAYRSTRAVLNGLNLRVHEGERVVVRGGMGTGKTTLMLTALGLIEHRSGDIRLMDHYCLSETDFAEHRGQIGLLFQDPDDQLIGPTVLEDIEFGPLNLGWSAERAHRTADDALNRVGLDHLADRAVHELSGGEKRLIALAGLLAMSPKLLLLDEPTAYLDEPTAQQLIHILIKSSLSMLIATHDPLCIETLATRSVLLKDGRLSED